VNGSPRFFCENCGAEVPRGAKRCASCGRHFASVLCPKCGFSGAEGLFSSGCPVCGYCVSPRQSAPKSRSPSEMKPAGALPLWVYALTFFFLLLVAAAAIALLR